MSGLQELGMLAARTQAPRAVLMPRPQQQKSRIRYRTWSRIPKGHRTACKTAEQEKEVPNTWLSLRDAPHFAQVTLMSRPLKTSTSLQVSYFSAAPAANVSKPALSGLFRSDLAVERNPILAPVVGMIHYDEPEDENPARDQRPERDGYQRQESSA